MHLFGSCFSILLAYSSVFLDLSKHMLKYHNVQVKTQNEVRILDPKSFKMSVW